MLKIRASASGRFMTGTRKEPVTGIGDTTMSFLRELYISERYSRDKEFTSNAIQKGIMNEEEGITMLSEHLGEFLTKNINHYDNGKLTGTPDIIHDSTVYDLKCSYSIWTFAEAELTPAYNWQLQVYMELLGLEKACLVYCLTDTPDSIIQKELKRILWEIQEGDVNGEIEEGLYKQMTYKDIDPKDRIKLFPVERDPSMIEKLYKKIELCEPIYQNMKL